MICSNCKHEISAGAKFCGSCGAALLASQTLFSDLPGSDRYQLPVLDQTGNVRLGAPFENTLPESPLISQQPQHVERISGDGMFGRRMNGLGFALAQLYQLLILVIFFMIVISLKAVFTTDEIGIEDSAMVKFFNVLSLVLSMALIVILVVTQVSIYVRRLHDLDKSGFYYLLSFVPVLSLVMWIYLLFASGVKGPNKYGYPVSSINFLVVLGFKKPKTSNPDLKNHIQYN